MMAYGSITLLKVASSSVDPAQVDPSTVRIYNTLTDLTAAYSEYTLAMFTGEALVSASGLLADVVYEATMSRSANAFTVTDWVPVLTKKVISENLGTFINTINNTTVPGLEQQIDRQISYYFYESALGQTYITASGSDTWTTDELKKVHHGDVAYDKTTGSGYYYDRTTATWVLINSATNAGVIEALKAAAAAKASADGIVVSYYAVEQSTAPATSKLWLNDAKLLQEFTTTWQAVPVKDGDTLTTYVTSTKDTKVYVFNGTSWVTETGLGVVASSKAVTDLKLSLGDLNNSIYGTSGLEQTLRGEIIDGVATAESKFAYNSTITVNNVPYSTGFGLSNSAGTGIGSEFWIDADKLKFTNTLGQYTATPFSIDASGTQPQVTFNGKVTFGSGQTGTIDEAIAASIESVVVGDKNINITDNLIPTTSLIADVNNAGYQFVGDPAKGLVAGIDTFAEVQVVLDGDVGAVDEVYSPYVDEVVFPYYYRFGIKGVTGLTGKFQVVMINDSDELNPVVTYGNVTVTLEPGKSMVADNWYIVDGIINPANSLAGTSGRILTPALEKIATIDNFSIATGTTKMLLGWVGSCTISRMKLAKITADTFTGSVATVDYVERKGYVAGSDIYASGTTEIDGGKIKTGTLLAEYITTANKDTLYERIVFNSEGIVVYDNNNVVRVKIGKL